MFCRTQREIFWRKFVTRLFWGTIDFHSRKKNTMEVNGAPELLCFPRSSEYLPLCSAEQRNSYRLGTTWGWVNDDRIFIFGWTIPLSPQSTQGLSNILMSRTNKCVYSRAGTQYFIIFLWIQTYKNNDTIFKYPSYFCQFCYKTEGNY